MSEREATSDSGGQADNPLDALLEPLKAWVEAREAERAERVGSQESDGLPDDIPRYIVRYP